jgi:hypothetical protein
VAGRGKQDKNLGAGFNKVDVTDPKEADAVKLMEQN